MTLGKGRGAAASDSEIAAIAQKLKVHPAVIEAIGMAESGGSGYFKDGRVKILTEPHWFRKLLVRAKKTTALRKAQKAGLTSPNYNATRRSGHYRRMGNRTTLFSFLQKMINIGGDYGYQSVSAGKYQIMCFHYKKCGFSSGKDMFDKFADSESYQLQALVKFLVSAKLVTAMRKKQWRRIENGYNGGGQNGIYADRMAKFYARLMKGKWRNWKPGVAIEVVTAMADGMLTRGESGNEVRALIGDLHRMGYYDGVLDDSFGNATEEAVIEFQEAFELLPDGKAGPQTLSAIKTALKDGHHADTVVASVEDIEEAPAASLMTPDFTDPVESFLGDPQKVEEHLRTEESRTVKAGDNVKKKSFLGKIVTWVGTLGTSALYIFQDAAKTVKEMLAGVDPLIIVAILVVVAIGIHYYFSTLSEDGQDAIEARVDDAITGKNMSRMDEI